MYVLVLTVNKERSKCITEEEERMETLILLGLLLSVFLISSQASDPFLLYTNASCVRILSRPTLSTRCGPANGENCWSADSCAVFVSRQSSPAGLVVNLFDCSAASDRVELDFWVEDRLQKVAYTQVSDLCRPQAPLAAHSVNWSIPLVVVVVVVLALGPLKIVIDGCRGWLSPSSKTVVRGSVWY